MLDCLRADDVDEAERLLAVMDDVYAVLITVDYPDALTAGCAAPPMPCARCSSAPAVT